MLSEGVWSFAESPLLPSPPSLAFTGEPAPCTDVFLGAFVNGDSPSASPAPPLGAATASDNLVASSTTSSSMYLDFSLISGEGENTIQTSLFETSFNPAVVQTNSRGLSPVDILLRRSFFGNSNDFENSPIKILKDEINQNPSSFLRISVDLSSRIDINSDLRVNSKKYFLLSKNDVDRYYDALVLNFKDYYVKKNTLNKILITPAGSNSVYEIKFLDLAREFTSSIVFRNNSNEKKITIKLNGSNVSELFLNASIIANNSILASNETFDFELIYNNMFTRSFYIRNRSGDISNIQVYLGEILIFPQEDSVPISPNQTGENSDENESNISDVMFEDDES